MQAAAPSHYLRTGWLNPDGALVSLEFPSGPCLVRAYSACDDLGQPVRFSGNRISSHPTQQRQLSNVREGVRNRRLEDCSEVYLQPARGDEELIEGCQRTVESLRLPFPAERFVLPPRYAMVASMWRSKSQSCSDVAEFIWGWVENLRRGYSATWYS